MKKNIMKKVVLLLITCSSVYGMQGGKAAINEAANSLNWDRVKQLANEGADVNTIDAWGNTAISQAAYWGEVDVVKLLLNKGADPNLVGQEASSFYVHPLMRKSGKTALESAIKGLESKPAQKAKYEEIINILKCEHF